MEKECKQCGAYLSIFMGEETIKKGLCQNCLSLKEVLKANTHLCATDFM